MRAGQIVEVRSRGEGDFRGEFVALGTGYEELTNGVGQYTTAIVLNPSDGRMCNIDLNQLTVIEEVL